MSSAANDPVHGTEADRFGGWTWREPSRGEHYRTCSYCGSIHPDDLAVEPEWRADWADAKYGWPHKFYVQIPSRTPDQQFVIGSSNGVDAPGSGWIPVEEIPDSVHTDGWRDLQATYRWVLIGTRPNHHAKFYSAHLADPGADQQALETIQQVSGVRFHFHDGRVTWERST